MALFGKKKPVDLPAAELEPAQQIMLEDPPAGAAAAPALMPEQKTEKKRKKRNKPQDRTRLTRNKVVQIRLTEDEVAELKAAAGAADMSMADYIMAGLNQSRRITLPGGGQILHELNKEGNNLNQAVMICHAAVKEEREPDITALLQAAERIEQAAQDLIDLQRRWDIEMSKEVKPDADREMQGE
jgi:hypothetical protein